MVRVMMNKIFQCIETELNSLIALGDKIDSFNSLYMLVKMSHHVWTAENVDPASYLSTTLGNVLVTVKRNFDKCIVSRREFEFSDTFNIDWKMLWYSTPPPFAVWTDSTDGRGEDFQEKQSWHPAFCCWL